MQFSVDRPCAGALPELNAAGRPTGRLLTSVSDFAALLRLASRYDRLRVVAPEGRESVFRLELHGQERPVGWFSPQPPERCRASGPIPGAEWVHSRAHDGTPSERRFVVVPNLDAFLGIVITTGAIDVELPEAGAEVWLRVPPAPPAARPRRGR